MESRTLPPGSSYPILLMHASHVALHRSAKTPGLSFALPGEDISRNDMTLTAATEMFL